MKTPCPGCGGKTRIRGTYTEKDSGDSLIVRTCSDCRTDWVHARRSGRWYRRFEKARGQQAAGSPDVSGGALQDSRPHRIGRLIAVFDVANEAAGLQTKFIERHIENPKFVSYNWKLECETNAISSLEDAGLRATLDGLIQKSLGDRGDMRSEDALSADEQQIIRAEYRRYKTALTRKLREPTASW